MNMASVCVARFGQVGRRTAVKLMVVGAVGLMSLAGTNPALAASDDQASFWTQFTPSVDTRLIFVSSSAGNDSNSGLTPATPVKTIARGYQLLRDGSPDWLLLKRGDTWVEALPNWMKSGRSESEKMVMGAYGDGDSRPQIRPPDGVVGMNAIGNSKTDHVAFVGFHLEPKERLGDSSPVGFRWLRRGEDILFEDLFVGGWSANFILQAAGDGVVLKDFRINGCVIVDAWSTTSHSQGLFIYGTDGMVIENSVIASNGFNPDRGADPTIYNHNVYVQNGSGGVVLRDCIVADAASHGVQMRPGGVIEGNLFLSNPISILVGGGTNPDAGGVIGNVKNNTIMYGRGIGSSLPRSMGIDLSNIREATVFGNILAISQIDYNGSPIQISRSGEHGVTDTEISRNTIVNWHGAIAISAPGNGHVYRNIVLNDNAIYRDLTQNGGNPVFNKSLVSIFDANHAGVVISSNHYSYFGMHSRPFMEGASGLTVDSWASNVEPDGIFTAVSQPPSGLELESYMTSVGRQGGLAEFLNEARLQSRKSFDPAISSGSVHSWARTRYPL